MAVRKMITSTSNPKVKQIRSLQARRKARWQEKRYVVEGQRMAQEIIKAGIAPELVLHTEHLSAKGRGLINRLARLGAGVELVSDEVMSACSQAETAPGLLAVLPIPELKPPEHNDLVVILDHVGDPGNLGTILRTAVAAGASSVYLTEGTVDPYNPKVVRGGMGAHLHIPVGFFNPGPIGAQLEGLTLWIAEQKQGVPYYEVDWREPVALAIGSEARGVGEELRSVSHGSVRIPMQGEIESLNAGVAAGVVLFEIYRQREGR
jgi:TrmH family RNA methyltransferase